ncbi:hypothetical protein [Streptomyces sp. NBC_01244]|uniref:hypothetical protein n=1 Tax=Streptomyces sp. NBC_01244 TaxID=2903797 RepID=UPI002E12CDC6|nr:hypothetical protein OG247_41590 [Streptomyces sp. NBC_01244]
MRGTAHAIVALALAAPLGVTGLGGPASADAGNGTEERATPSRPAYRVTLYVDGTGTGSSTSWTVFQRGEEA